MVLFLLLVEIALLVGACYITVSLLEWWIHRHHMHRSGWINRIDPSMFTVHQKIHHPAYRDSFNHANPELHANLGLRIQVIELTVMAAIVVTPLWFLYPLAAIVFTSCICLHASLWNLLHCTMHRPDGWRWGRSWWLRWFYRYHYYHHVYPNRNFNIICPGADWLFGTRAKPTEADAEVLENTLNGQEKW